MKGTLIFVAGVVVGSVVTWKIVEKRYKDLADDEIESVKDMFLKRNTKNKKKDKIEKLPEESETKEEVEELSNGQIVDYAGVVKRENYNSEESSDEETVNVDDFGKEYVGPYVIEPEEFGTIDEYGTKTLTYWADDVLTDEVDHVISDREVLIGADALEHFGDYEEDAVHIRDVANEMDYEIIKSEKKFSETIKRGND